MSKTVAEKKAASPVPLKQKAVAATKTAAAKPPVKRAAKPAAAKVKAAPAKPKAAPAPAPQPAPKPAVAAKPVAASLNGHAGAPAVVAEKKPAAPPPKVKKAKLVRDSFTMPEAEYQVLGDVKKACLKAGIDAKKSELLRVGVALLKQLDPAKLKTALAALPPLKAGRPKKEK